MKTYSVLLMSILAVSCSSSPFNVKKTAVSLYESEDDRICPDIKMGESNRKEGAYCLGWIYLNETKGALPKVDTLAFKDIKPGDPYIPYIWLSIASGFMSPKSYDTFGVGPMNQDEWDEAIEKVQKKIKHNKKNGLSLR